MNTKILGNLIVGFLVVILVGTGGYFFLRDKKASNSEVNIPQDTNQAVDNNVSVGQNTNAKLIQEASTTTTTTIISTEKKVPVPAVDVKPAPRKISSSRCGMAVISPEMNSVVSFPLNISVIVDNSNSATLGCAWTVFEGQAGVVSLIDSNNNVLGSNFLSTSNQNWMENLIAGLPVSFATTLNLTAQPTAENLSLVFTEDNPSGQGTPDSLILPVLIQF